MASGKLLFFLRAVLPAQAARMCVERSILASVKTGSRPEPIRTPLDIQASRAGTNHPASRIFSRRPASRLTGFQTSGVRSCLPQRLPHKQKPLREVWEQLLRLLAQPKKQTMPTKVQVDKVLPDAACIINVWTANPEFALGDMTLEKFKAATEAVQTASNTVDAKRTELTGLINARDTQAAELAEWVTRARSGFRAVYGPDSTQYEQAGGTRTSERKKPLRKTPELDRKAA
jgi:hypothetical protein